MTTPKSRGQDNTGTTADARQASEPPTGKPTVSRDDHGANVGQREADAESDGGKQTIGAGSRDSNVGQRAGESGEQDKPSGKQTIESSREAASLGQRPTRDDGANDDKGELK